MDIQIVRDVLDESNQRARENRELFDRSHTFVINLMGSPGSGKTDLLLKTVPALTAEGISCAVIEGDITTTLDTERLKPLGIPVVQANTEPFGGDCHLGSHLVQGAIKFLDLSAIRVLFLENIGNLVCPAEFYLGEDRKVVLLSVAEGEDKPLKYPLMFRESHLCLLGKIDLVPYLGVDVNRMKANVRLVNGKLKVIALSSRAGLGLEEWTAWLRTELERAAAARRIRSED